MSFGNEARDGSSNAWWLLVDAQGRQIMVGPAAHDAAAVGSPVRVGGVYHAADPAGADGDILDMLVDAAGRRKVVGAAAENAAVVGNPVLTGGRYDVASRVLNDGDVGGIAVDVGGRLKAVGAAFENTTVVGSPVLVAGRYDAAARTLDNLDVGGLAVDVTGRALVNLGWSPSLQADEALNDSDKSFTVPANTEWRVKWIWVEYTSDANAGNRQLEIQIQDGAADVIGQVRAGLVQAATNTYYYLFAPHVTELAAVRDGNYLSTIMPEWILSAGYIVRVWDNKAIAAATDDVVIQMMVEARTV